MKKYFLILLIGFLILMPGVKADTLILSSEDYTFYNDNYNLLENKSSILIDYFNSNLSSDYQYYCISRISTGLGLFVFNDQYYFKYSTNLSNNIYYFDIKLPFSNLYSISLSDSSNEINIENPGDYSFSLFSVTEDMTDFSLFKFPFYKSNFDVFLDFSVLHNLFKNWSFNELEVKKFNNYTDNIVLLENKEIPLISDLLRYDSFSDYDKDNNSEYTEVNLDNYEYVILNLKDYSKKDSFSTNLKVKGMVGITPVYEFGTAEKTEITDRCNLSYSDYTDYRLYVLKSDLQNNSVYYVKSCESGSSFKFDNSVFDITYVTSENKDNPVITVYGQEYNTIPFDKLSNSANKNEENNFVPGESGSSLTNFIDNITDYISSFWKSLTSFMSLVTKFFNTLPIEIRAVCITTFTTACVLGLIKIIKS